MRQPKTNTLQKPMFKLKPSDVFTPTHDDDNRIDWERKNKKKKPEDEAIVEAPAEILELEPDDNEETLSLEVRHKSKPPKKGKKDKRRQLVLDEDTGRVFVKRRRKSNRHYEWDEYE